MHTPDIILSEDVIYESTHSFSLFTSVINFANTRTISINLSMLGGELKVMKNYLSVKGWLPDKR